MDPAGDPQGTPAADRADRPAPAAPSPLSFGELIRGNLRVVGVATVLAAGCYGIWRGLRTLFPEVDWLQ